MIKITMIKIIKPKNKKELQKDKNNLDLRYINTSPAPDWYIEQRKQHKAYLELEKQAHTEVQKITQTLKNASGAKRRFKL